MRAQLRSLRESAATYEQERALEGRTSVRPSADDQVGKASATDRALRFETSVRRSVVLLTEAKPAIEAVERDR
jgi:hypothetical protein